MMTPPRRSLLLFGYGFSARALVRRLDKSRWSLFATATSEEKAALLAASGIASAVYDGTAPSASIRAALREATHVLVSAPPDVSGDPVLKQHADDLRAAPHLEWIGYLSTIGVYGDRQGGWIDEADAPTPMQERSRHRYEAENAWQSLAESAGKRCVLFRLAGIYGPGRSAVDNVRSGRARRIVKPGQHFNRIHVEDIARVVEASMNGLGRYDVYNLADDEASPPEDVIAYAAELLGLPLPPAISYDDPSISAMQRSFYAESKRVRNDRLKQDLGIALAYPTYREGLAAIAAGAAGPDPV